MQINIEIIFLRCYNSPIIIMEMILMDVLSIGNSFSQDAHRYLHQIAKAGGVELSCFNLYIGGCSLSKHYRNMMADSRAYTLQMNGTSTGFPVSIKEALLNRDWDVVTLQQASLKSVDYETYQPYLNKLADYVRLMVPKAKIVIHQTWAYEEGSDALHVKMGYNNHKDMFAALEAAYKNAAKDINADFIIPSGELFQKIISCNVGRVHRDTHAGFGLGRYALGLLWYALLTGNSVANNIFSDFDEEVTDIQINAAKKCVEEICNR